MFSCCIFFTSDANTASAEAVESIQLACGGEKALFTPSLVGLREGSYE